MYILSMRIL